MAFPGIKHGFPDE